VKTYPRYPKQFRYHSTSQIMHKQFQCLTIEKHNLEKQLYSSWLSKTLWEMKNLFISSKYSISCNVFKKIFKHGNFLLPTNTYFSLDYCLVVELKKSMGLSVNNRRIKIALFTKFNSNILSIRPELTYPR